MDIFSISGILLTSIVGIVFRILIVVDILSFEEFSSGFFGIHGVFFEIFLDFWDFRFSGNFWILQKGTGYIRVIYPSEKGVFPAVAFASGKKGESSCPLALMRWNHCEAYVFEKMSFFST